MGGDLGAHGCPRQLGDLEVAAELAVAQRRSSHLDGCTRSVRHLLRSADGRVELHDVHGHQAVCALDFLHDVEALAQSQTSSNCKEPSDSLVDGGWRGSASGILEKGIFELF